MDWRRLVLLPPPTSVLPPPPPSSFSPPPPPSTSPPSPPSPPLHPPTTSSSPLLRPPLAFARGTEVFPLPPPPPPPPVNPSVSLLRLLAAFIRSLSGHDRERGVLVPLPPPLSSPPPPLPVAPSLFSACGFCARLATVARLNLRNFRKLLCNTLTAVWICSTNERTNENVGRMPMLRIANCKITNIYVKLSD